MAASPQRLHVLGTLLCDPDIWDTVAGAIADARDKAPRHEQDRDSAEVLDEVIAALRAA